MTGDLLAGLSLGAGPSGRLLLGAALALLVLGVVIGAALLWRLRALGAAVDRLERADGQSREQLRADLVRLEDGLRDEVARSAQSTRLELGEGLGRAQQLMLAQTAEAARTQNDQLRALIAATDRRLGEMRSSIEARLGAIQQDNDRRLEQMRATVDERLQSTLEQRLGDSFRQVAERLEQVHRGLGEMQTLARDVGSLHRVLTNVKSRGIWGEVQLEALLEQVFTPAQYGRNVATVPGSNDRVEFALRLPGRRDGDATVWLPIDAKFPREDYERLLDALERADPLAAEGSRRALELRLRAEARSLADKYLAPPHTTDFAILFLPTEGLYAEALRRAGLQEALQRDHKVMLAGPTTLLATLTSLQVGFRTLALERRSSEVWEVLGAVKTEFARFGDVLARTRRKLDEASRSIDDAETRTRAMHRRLKTVEALPEARAAELLGPADVANETAADPPGDLPDHHRADDGDRVPAMPASRAGLR